MRVPCDEYSRLVAELLTEKRMPTEVQKDIMSAHRRHCEEHRHDDALDKLAAIMTADVVIEKTLEPVKFKRCVLCQQVCLHDEDEWVTEGQLTHRLQYDPAGKRGDLVEVNGRHYCKSCSRRYGVEKRYEIH